MQRNVNRQRLSDIQECGDKTRHRQTLSEYKEKLTLTICFQRKQRQMSFLKWVYKHGDYITEHNDDCTTLMRAIAGIRMCMC